MVFLPIVRRELRVWSRKRITHWIRLAGAFIPVAFGAWLAMVSHNQPPQSLGKTLFGGLAFMIFLFAFGAGTRFTADCLSEEKREGTLGLLFLTDLRPIDIILGKMAATSLTAIYGMLAVFPVLAISLLLGGVTYGEFWRVLLVAFNLLLFSLSCGMIGSSICQDDRKAMATTVLLLLATSVISPLTGWLLSNGSNSYWTGFNYFSPVAGCFLGIDSLYAGHRKDFWINTIFTFGLTVLALFLASKFVRASWLRQGAKSSNNVKNLENSVRRRLETSRQEALDRNPYFWLAGRKQKQTMICWIVLGVSAALWLWGYLEHPRDWLNGGTYVATAIILHSVFRFGMATESCRRFVEDRRSGALELILSTPLSVPAILRGQIMALIHAYGKPVVFVLAADIIFLFAGLRDVGGGGDERLFWILLFVGGIGIFLLDMVTIAYLGMWMGMVHSRANLSAGTTLTKVLVLPSVCFVLVVTLANFLFPFRDFWTDQKLLLFWFGLAVINDLAFFWWSKSRLELRFRHQATIPFKTKKTPNT